MVALHVVIQSSDHTVTQTEKSPPLPITILLTFPGCFQIQAKQDPNPNPIKSCSQSHTASPTRKDTIEPQTPCRCPSEEALVLTCSPKRRTLPSLVSALGLHCFKALLVSITAPPVAMVMCTICASSANFHKWATAHFAKPMFREAFGWLW